MDVGVTHFLSGVRGEGGSESTAAIHDDFGRFVRISRLEIALEDAFAQVNGFLGVTLGPFVVFSHVHQYGVRVGGQAVFGVRDGDFVDAGLGVVDEGEKSG